MDYEFDIFISYPSALNKSPYPGWVDKVYEGLHQALNDEFRSLHGHGRALNIYFDKVKIEANSSHQDMIDAARRSRLFLAIVSPDYQTRDWAPKELEEFTRELKDPKRLFVIEARPLPENDVILPGLKGVTFKELFDTSTVSGDAPLPLYPEDKEFKRGIYEVARSIARKLGDMRQKEAGASRAPDRAPDRSGDRSDGVRTLLLAHVSDDLYLPLAGHKKSAFQTVSDELEQYCRDYSVRLLSGADYPLGAADFKAAFEKDLAEADLVVQLLGETLGKRPRDLPEGYVLYQARRAAAQPGICLMQWRRSDIDVRAVGDNELHDLMQGETVTASTLASFQNSLLEWVKTPPKPPAKPQDASDAPLFQVFINAEKTTDWVAAMRCKDALNDLCSGVWFPPEGSRESESIQEELDDILKVCDTLLFMSGKVEAVWLGKQLRQAMKTRAKYQLPMRGVICDGPPVDKIPMHGSVRGVEPINCKTPDGNDWQFQTLHDYLSRMAAASL